jgi:hypothetical protein
MHSMVRHRMSRPRWYRARSGSGGRCPRRADSLQLSNSRMGFRIARTIVSLRFDGKDPGASRVTTGRRRARPLEGRTTHTTTKVPVILWMTGTSVVVDRWCYGVGTGGRTAVVARVTGVAGSALRTGKSCPRYPSSPALPEGLRQRPSSRVAPPFRVGSPVRRRRLSILR